MKYYKYKAINFKSKIINGIYKTNDIYELMLELKKDKLFLLECKEIKYNRLKLKKSFTLREVYIICNKMYQFIKSGIDLITALNLLIYETKDDFSKKVFLQNLEDISKGQSLYNSMKNQKKIYPLFMISMIEVGEQSGNLEDVFLKLSKHYYYLYRIQSKIKKSLAYPKIIVTVSFFSILILRLKAIPAFLEILKQIGGKEPISTKIFISLFDNSALVLMILILMFLSGFLLKNKYYFKLKFKIPILSKYFYKIEQLKFIKSLNILISSGVNVVTSIETILNCTENDFIKLKYKCVLDNLNKGNSLYESLDSIKMFDKLVISMISAGEVSGQLDNMIYNIEKILQNEIEDKINNICESLEPILIIIIAVFIGFILISALMPIINVISSLNNFN